jgi:hypothetical protein
LEAAGSLPAIMEAQIVGGFCNKGIERSIAGKAEDVVVVLLPVHGLDPAIVTVTAGEMEDLPARTEKMNSRRFPPPWRIVEMPGCIVVRDATGQNVAWFHFRDCSHRSAAAQETSQAEG